MDNSQTQTRDILIVDPSQTPKVSILIPMRNEREYVAQCLESVLAQIKDHPDWEIFCIEGRSTDGTADIVRQFAQNDSRIRLIDNPEQIVPTGLNLAIAQAKGDVIIRLDCHSVFSFDYIAKCLEVLRRTGADNVGGYMQTVPGKDTPVGRAIAAATSSRFGAGGSTFRTTGPERETDTVPFGCFRRDVFERFGAYNARLVRNQDIELNSRIRKGGGKIVISPEIKLTYYNRHTYSGLREQAFANGLWVPHTLHIAGGGLCLRHWVPLGFVAANVILALAGIWFPAAWLAWAGMMILYLAMAAAISFREARVTKASAFYMLLALVQLHFAYGVGSLWGVILCLAPSGPSKALPPPASSEPAGSPAHVPGNVPLP